MVETIKLVSDCDLAINKMRKFIYTFLISIIIFILITLGFIIGVYIYCRKQLFIHVYN